MGTKHSTERKPAKSPQEEKREKDDKEHKDYLNKVLARSDASAELKSTLIECAESKKTLKIVHASNDALQVELSTAHTQYNALALKLDQTQELQRIILISNGFALFAIFLLLFVVYVFTSSRAGVDATSTYIAQPIGQSPDGASQFPKQDIQGDHSDILIISRDSFAAIYTQLQVSQSRSELTGFDAAQYAFTALQTYKSTVSYYQVLRIIQQELLPQITFTLVATCLGITLIFTAIVGSIVPHWKDMSVKRRFYAVLHSTVVFFALGLYLSTLHDSIDIPAGVVLTIAVLGCPVVVFTGVDLYTHSTRQVAMLPNELEWSTILSAISVFAFSVVLLHTISFAPLVVLAIGAVSVAVWVLLDLALHSIHTTKRSRLISLVLWLGTLALWSCSDTLVDILQPSRQNATYSLVTNVSTWLDWGLMLAAFVWYLESYVFTFYRTAASLEWAQARNHPPPVSISLAVILNFAHIALFLYISLHSTGARAVTVSAYAHLCGVFVALEAFMLVAFTHTLLFGAAELVCALQAALLMWTTLNNYTMLMVFSVLNVAMYILLKFGVLVAAGVAAAVIAGVVLAR